MSSNNIDWIPKDDEFLDEFFSSGKSFEDLFRVDDNNPFGVDDNNSFGDYTETYVKKMLIENEKTSIIDNYGIYDYFKKCESVPTKLMGAIYNGLYVINTGMGDSSDHYGLGAYITDRYGSCNCLISSYGVELNVYISSELSDNTFYSLERCFRELRDYYLETGNNKRISFIGKTYEDRLSKYEDCEEIDDIILDLSNLKEETFKKNTDNNERFWI